jgi:ribosomal subunit interface protein
MHVQITARHCNLSDDIHERARTLAERWPRFDRATSAARLVFEIQGLDHKVEAIVSRDRQEPVVATGQGSDFRAALDEVDGRIGRMLRRDNEKRKDHQAHVADGIG